MSTYEIFNQQRAAKCVSIARAVMDERRRTKKLSFTIKAPVPLTPPGLSDFRPQYFAVGIGENILAEVPFVDLLSIIWQIEQELLAIKAVSGSGRESADVRIIVRSSFTDDEAKRLLSLVAFTAEDGTQWRLGSPPEDSADWWKTDQ